MNKNIKLKDFKSICRFCLEKEPYMKQIFSNGDDDNIDYGISEMIEFCLGIKILPDDKLPKFLCKKCYKELLNCNKFHKKCFSAEETLKNVLKMNEEQNKHEISVVTEAISIITDPLDFNFTEHTEEICSDSINESTVDIKEEEIYEWTAKENDHDVKSEEIIIDESDVHEIDNIKNDYSNNIIENDPPNKEDENSLSCTTSDGEIIKKRKRNCKRDPKRYQCPICGKLVTKITTHMETHSDIKKHKCPHCDGTFRTKYNLIEHINGHFDLRPHKCKHCDRSFNSRKSLYVHSLRHNKEEKYECNICGRKFVYESTYRYHMKVHNQIRQHKCDICNREFITKHAIKKHYRVHTGERPYKCKECDKCFRSFGALSEHRKVHTKEISHYCNKCNAGFVYKSTLNNHLKKCQ